MCAVLEKARGGDLAEIDDDGASSVASSVRSSASLTASSRASAKPPAAAAAASSSLSSLAPRGAAAPATPSVDGDADDPLGFMSLQLAGTRDPRQAKLLNRHANREIKPPVDVREQMTKQLQALLDGRGGKYVHADYVPNGATQIGGMRSMTPSMTAGPIEGQFAGVATKLGAAGPPRIRNLPSDFRTA